jgi:hypothetical protein
MACRPIGLNQPSPSPLGGEGWGEGALNQIIGAEPPHPIASQSTSPQWGEVLFVMFHAKPVKLKRPAKAGRFSYRSRISPIQFSNSQVKSRAGRFSAPRRRFPFPFPERGVERREAPERVRSALDGASGSAGTLAKRSASPNVREKRRLRALHPGGGYLPLGVCVEEYIPIAGNVKIFVCVHPANYSLVMPGLVPGISLTRVVSWKSRWPGQARP